MASSDHKIDFVVESTGVFTTQEQCMKHVQAGAKKVLLTVPPKGDVDAMIVMGVNEDALKPAHKVISNASCTTNCLAPFAKVLDDSFVIKKGWMTTIHSYTNDQNVLDLPHKDLRRARSAALSMIPTTTGAAKAVGEVLPQIKGKMTGMPFRTPTPDVSVVDLTFRSVKETSIEEIDTLL